MKPCSTCILRCAVLGTVATIVVTFVLRRSRSNYKSVIVRPGFHKKETVKNLFYILKKLITQIPQSFFACQSLLFLICSFVHGAQVLFTTVKLIEGCVTPLMIALSEYEPFAI